MTAPAEKVRAALLRAGRDDALPAAEALAAYLELLLRANEAVNLVSRREATFEALLERHLLDALDGLPFLPRPGSGRLGLLDVGSGGGFPAIPLLLVRTDLQGTLVEATGKKARFLVGAMEALGLTGRIVNARFPAPALELMRNAPPRALLTSRAVADAAGILRQARPALAPEAVALLWTTAALADELRRALPKARVAFHLSAGAERRGIARVERFT